MKQTNEKLKEVVQKIEEANTLYKEILKDMDNFDQDNRKASSKSLKIKINEKSKVLDPSVHFDITEDLNSLNFTLPLGHIVTSFYYRNPNQPNPSYQTEPVSLKPWLAYRTFS